MTDIDTLVENARDAWVNADEFASEDDVFDAIKVDLQGRLDTFFVELQKQGYCFLNKEDAFESAAEQIMEEVNLRETGAGLYGEDYVRGGWND